MEQRDRGVRAQERVQVVDKLRQALELVRQARHEAEHSATPKTIENLLTAEAVLEDSLFSFE